MSQPGDEKVLDVLRDILATLAPEASMSAIARSAALIEQETPKLSLTTKRTLRERILTLRVAQILHAHEEAPGPTAAAGPGVPTP